MLRSLWSQMRRGSDAILHVDPAGDTEGMLVICIPLSQGIKRDIRVNLYHTGLKDRATVNSTVFVPYVQGHYLI